MIDYRFLSQNLRRLRAEGELSQAEIAERAGAPFTQQYISALERGLRPRDDSHLAVLAAALNVSEAALIRRVRRRVDRAADRMLGAILGPEALGHQFAQNRDAQLQCAKRRLG